VVADAAYAVCLRLARQHYENFPVASRLLPRRVRPHVAAVYAFARIADDFADEGTRSDEARLALLDDWRERLHMTATGRTVVDGSDAAAIFIALGRTMETCELDIGLFEDLLSAFRQDVLVKRYDAWSDLLDYCRRSANPIGRLVLGIGGYRDDRLDEQSDAICTALQLTNFWQDLERDWATGRLYVPRELWRATGADEVDLERRQMTLPWQQALADAAGRTRALFAAGRPLADGVRGRLVWELRATWAGGVRILDRLEATRFDVFRRRPTLGWADAGALGWTVVTWRRGPRPARRADLARGRTTSR
jgi:squalene synthase HpnC